MPLREDLLEPIAGANPSGPDLRYDPIFDQIREARREEDDSLPAGDWGRTAKKAEHPVVVKLAGEALANRSKDLRLASNLAESIFKIDGLEVLAPAIEFLRNLQANFWETIYPEIDEGDLQLRVNEIERFGRQAAVLLRKVPVTKSGLSADDYKESRTVGYEADATTDERRKNRQAAIEAEQLTAEEFDKAAASTPKAFFVTVKAQLDEAISQTGQLDQYQREAYGGDYPELLPLVTALNEVDGVVSHLLAERRKIEPDPVVTLDKVAAMQGDPNAPAFSLEDHDGGAQPQAAFSAMDSGGMPSLMAMPALGEIARPEDAYMIVVSCAQVIFEADTRSAVPYLVCAGLRLGETRMQGPTPSPGFAVGPTAQTRQALRSYASNGAWTELLRATLPVMAQPCARAWLDLHRYIWRAARETGAGALETAVAGTLRELLLLRPEVRQWTLEDDTGAANPETQIWIDAEVLRT